MHILNKSAKHMPARSGVRHFDCVMRHTSSASAARKAVLPHVATIQRELEVQADWTDQTFPTYLQSLSSYEPVSSSDSSSSMSWDSGDSRYDHFWKCIRREAHREADFEPVLSSFLYASILAHDSFERALAFVLSARLQNSILLASTLFDTFYEVLMRDPDVVEGALSDLEAFTQRDPACLSASVALLYYKGYHSIQTHRISHALYKQGHKVIALALQNRLSEALGVDIHPGAVLGKGLFMDHACGIVIGETCVIGNNVTIMQGVTLGGTGKESGDRHPKIADNVLIGPQSSVLGNISVGEGAMVAPGSMVLKPVPPYAMVAGAPAKPVGQRLRPTDGADGITAQPSYVGSVWMPG